MSQAGANPWERQFVNLGRVMQILRDETSLDNLVTATLDYLRDNFDYKLIWLALYDESNHRLVGKGGVTPAGEIKFLRERFALNAGDLFDQVILQRRPVPIADLRREIRSGEWQKVAQKFDIQGSLVWPIYQKDHTYGLVLLGSTQWNVSPRAEEKSRLSMVLGGLATTLDRLDAHWQEQNEKRPHEPLLSLLDKLHTITSLPERLEVIVQESHEFIMASRTNIYWFEREQQYFWKRTSNRQAAPASRRTGNEPNLSLNSQNSPGLYQSLAKDQVIVITDSNNMGRSEISYLTVEQIGAKALVAAPIFFQTELLGFLSVESDQPRLWTEDERQFIRGAAQMAALTAPLEEMEVTLQRIATDQVITAGIARAIYSERDLQDALNMAADQLCQRLGVERFWIATYDRDSDVFRVTFQHHPKNRRALPNLFAGLSQVDQQMMEQSLEPVMVENLDSDFKFLAWRNALLELDMKSLIVSSTSVGRNFEGIVVVGHENIRTWSKPEKDMVQAVAQQIGLIVHQSELQRQADERQKLQQSIQFGLVALQQSTSLEKLQQTGTQLIAQVMQAPLSLLLTWLPGRPGGQIASSFSSRDEFQLSVNETMLPIENDPLVQWVLDTEGILPLQAHDLPDQTKAWLNAPGIGTILGIALRTTPEHQPTGLLLVADRQGRRWLDRHLQAFSMLANQISWSRRHLVLVEQMRHHRQELERLNWYKQRRLEDLYRSVGSGVQRLLDAESRGGNVGSAGMSNIVLQSSLKQLQASLSPLPQIIRKEQWRLRSTYETAPLAGMLKRALERVDPLIKQRQIWSQVHSQANVVIGGDIAKIEMIINEVLLFACGRSEVGGRVDLWCRQIDDKLLELSITDYGQVDGSLLAALHEGRSPDQLMPSILDQPPGLHLMICQGLMHEVGGELSLYQLEDNRILSRLILPLSSGANPGG
ncbi:MAG: GAF domain-containing protein [Pseudanabaenaceae cyanobacterium]